MDQQQQQQQQDDANTNYTKQRVETLEALERDGKLECYPHKFQVTCELTEFRAKYEALTNGQHLETEKVSVTGRISAVRASSSKLVFYTIHSNGATLQVIANLALYGDNDAAHFELMTTVVLKRGDVIGVTGHPARSKSGEPSVMATRVLLLSPCLHNLPHPNTLDDLETRHRNRHLDMIVNQRVAETFRMRARIISFIRRFYDSRGYVEVETPMMNIIPGGANARPFVTHHNDLHTNMFLRIAPELYLKQLVVGGLDRVYEIGKNFRNEGIDKTHNPEYTAIETYCAYDDYEDVIRSTELLLSSMVKELTGDYVINYTVPGSDDGETPPVTHRIDFTPPFARYPMIKTLEEKLGVQFPVDLTTPETNTFLRELLAERGLRCGEPLTTVRLLDKLVGEYIEPLLVNPGFITDHPQITSPLAKWHRAQKGLTERFELFVAGRELCNAYTELNNPHVQRQMFQSEAKSREAGDDESQPVDEAFCVALEYGLPPTAGFGMGIDRLCMLLTNQQRIAEVILFPTLKPLEREREAQKQMAHAFQFAFEQFTQK
jgi:lysyl-tRNA synthetase, class II